MHYRCNQLLRWLLALQLCMGLAVAAELPANGDIQTTSIAQIQQASNTLDKVRQSLDDADTSETLQTLSEKALQSKRDADNAVTALEPLLKQIDARIAQLGPVAEGSEESPELSLQRKDLAQQHSELDSALKRGKLLSMEAKQTTDSIEKIRTQQFNAQIARKVASPLSPSLWKQFAEHLPTDLQRIAALTRQGRTSFNAAIAEHGWSATLTGIALALFVMFPLRIGLRYAGRKFASSERAPNGRLRRTGLAVWMLVVGTALPGLASLVFIESLRSIDAIAPRLQTVADAWIQSSFVAAFFLSVSACLLVPKRPTWRLLNIDDIAAPALTRFAWGAAGLTWFSMMLNAVDIAARTSAVSSVALDGLIALIYAVLIMSVLMVINKQRKRQQLAEREKAAHHGDDYRPAATSRWLMLAWLGGHLTVLAALIAALIGYLNFSVFAATQMVWITVVVLATSLLMKFADDVFTWLCSSESRIGQGFDRQRITSLAAKYHPTSKWQLGLELLQADGRHYADAYREREGGFVALVQYGELDERKAGSFASWLRYYDQPSASVLYPTMDADTGFFRRKGFRGWGARTDYVITPGLVCAVEGFRLENRRESPLLRRMHEYILGTSITAYF